MNSDAIVFKFFKWNIIIFPREKGNYWIYDKPFGIYKLTNWLDWSVDLKWISFTIFVDKD